MPSDLRPPSDTAPKPFDLSAVSLRALQVFIAVAESGSMAAAATGLGLGRSTVTEQIASLERVLGVRLFDRAARPIAPTPAGTLLIRHARQILEAVKTAQVDLLDHSVSSLPELRLGLIDDLDATVTPMIVERLCAAYPNSLFSAASGRSDVITRELVERRCDIAVTAEPPDDHRSFDVTPLLREPFVVVAAKGVIADRRPDLAALRARPLVRYSAGMPLGRRIEQQLKRLRIDLPTPATFDASRSVFAMVCRAGGWAITTPLSVLDSERFRPRLDVFPLPFAGFNREIHLVARAGELGRLPQRLVQLCRALFQSELEGPAREIAPWVGDQLTVLGDDGAPLTERVPMPDFDAA